MDKKIISSRSHPSKSVKNKTTNEKKSREQAEKELDEKIKETFPASDATAEY